MKKLILISMVLLLASCGTTEKKGKDGFGYDPIFIPENGKLTFAEMSKEAKGEISHRGRAVRKLIAFLTTLEH